MPWTTKMVELIETAINVGSWNLDGSRWFGKNASWDTKYILL